MPERFGCMCCETRETIHAGNGMCPNCSNLWFVRLTQIVAEGIKGEPARKARGATWEQRQLPANVVRDGVHRTFYERSSANDLAMYQRIAAKLNITVAHVRTVAIGKRHSESVSAALKEESERPL